MSEMLDFLVFLKVGTLGFFLIGGFLAYSAVYFFILDEEEEEPT